MTTPRWYMVDKMGMATLCKNKKDAGKEARDMDMAWPHMGPHRAVQLVEAADVEALRSGYDAARLEIESLQARIKTMAEEHADELMVAHLDGRMRAAQTAPLEPTDDEIDAVVQACRERGLRELDVFRAVLAKWGNPAPAGVEPIGHLYCGGSYGDELEDWEIVADQHQCDKLNEHHGALGKEAKLPIYTTPQPTQATDSVLEDAARLDWLLLHISGAEFRRIGVHYSGNARRADVDAARKQGANHD